jgi:hypothetical protein
VAVTLPAGLVVAARVLLAVALIILGLSRFVDGYGMAIVTIGTGLLVAELVGLKLSAPEAEALTAEIVSLLKEYLPPSIAPPPPPPPVQ